MQNQFLGKLRSRTREIVYGGVFLRIETVLCQGKSLSKLKRNAKFEHLFSDEKKWQAIERWTEEGKESNKNYDTEALTVLSLSTEEVAIFDRFAKLKKELGLVRLKKNITSIFSKTQKGSGLTIPFKKFDRDLGKQLNITIRFNSTIFRKKMQTLWSQKVQHPKDLQTINTAMGQGWWTGLMHYTFQNKYTAS